jgi:hypothetical protein
MYEFFEYAKRMYERKARESKQRILETAYAIAIVFSKEARDQFLEQDKKDAQALIDLMKEHAYGK